jgi:hypothetical protein
MKILIILIGIIEWLEHHMLTCPSKALLGIDCPGCGIQRSFISLLKGNFIDSFYLYPALIPILAMLIFTGFHLKYKFKKGAELIKWLQFFCAIIILINYIYKILNQN